MTAAEPPRWRRLSPDARREQILECAAELFGERPYAAVSTTDIAQQAGVARGLLNHYFGTKRDLYLVVVRRLVMMPDVDVVPEGGSLRKRVEVAVDWFLDTIAQHSKTFVAVTGAEGVGGDPEVEQILAEADDRAASLVLGKIGVDLPVQLEHHRAVIRAFGGMAKAAIREWIGRGTLTRDQVRLLLTQSLTTILRDVLPRLPQE